MILLFAISLISSSHFAVDFGTQFIKMAQETFEGEPKIIPNEQNELYRPSAIAFKYSKPIPKILADADFHDLQIKYGKSAVSILKKNPQKGIRFLPHILGRNNDTFQTSTNANATDLLALSLMNEFKHISTSNSEVVAIVPSYWTHLQREMVAYSFSLANIQLSSLIEDIISLSSLYTHKKEAQLRENPKHVLFVDVGATSIKTYALYIKFFNDKFIANETARNWSEMSGTYFFAKSYSESQSISQFKAEKKIQKLKTGEGMDEPIEILKETIQETIKYAERTFNKTIDEIQMIGGGTKIPFVKEIIKEASGGKEVRQDFNPIEALSHGGIIYSQMSEDSSPLIPTYVVRLPNSDISINCDGRVSVGYCQKFNSCIHGALNINTDGCKRIGVIFSADGIPPGTNTTTQTITLKDMPYKGDSLAYGKVFIQSPDQYISKVQWCSRQKGKKCIDVPFDIDEDLYSGMKFSAKWISEYTKEKLSEERLKSLIADVEVKISKLSQFFNNAESVSAEATEKISNEMKEKYEKYQKDFEDGKISSFSMDSAKKADDELSNIMESLGIQ